MINFFKRLKVLFKRKNKNYKSNIKHNIIDIEFVDISNFSNTMYNIYCSDNKIPCDINTRELKYENMMNKIRLSNNDKIKDFTNSIYIINFAKMDKDLLDFINIMTNSIITILEDKIVISLSYYEIKYIQLIDTIYNDYLSTLKSNLKEFDFDYYTDNDNINKVLLPLNEDADKHIYMMENQLLNFINSTLSDGFNYSKLSVCAIMKSFIIVICFDNFEECYEDLIIFSRSYYKDKSRIICKFNFMDIDLITRYLSTKVSIAKDYEILFNFFNNTYIKTRDSLLEKQKINILEEQRNLSIQSEQNMLIYNDSIDEIIK